MGERFQGSECLFGCEVQDAFMRLDTREVEAHDAIEESLVNRKPLSMLRLVVQALPDRRCRFCHLIPALSSRWNLWYAYSLLGAV